MTSLTFSEPKLMAPFSYARNPAAAKSERNETVELLRIVAAAGIIWFHMETTPFKRVGLSGLVFFLVVSVIYQVASSHKGWYEYFRKRASRLLIPWLSWFAIYGMLNIMRGKALFPYTSGLLQNILSGPWIGLWYLPFSLFSACVVYLIVHFDTRPGNVVRLVYLVIVSVSTIILTSFIRASCTLVPPWSQWLHAAPSIPIGLALASALGMREKAALMVTAIQAGLLAACASAYAFDAGVAITYGLGSLLVTAGFMAKVPMRWQISKLGSFCLGVYLVHGAVMSGLKIFPWMTQKYFLWFLGTTIVSFLITALLRRMPYASKIV